jgi:hypothetical protein
MEFPREFADSFVKQLVRGRELHCTMREPWAIRGTQEHRIKIVVLLLRHRIDRRRESHDVD